MKRSPLADRRPLAAIFLLLSLSGLSVRPPGGPRVARRYYRRQPGVRESGEARPSCCHSARPGPH